VPFNPVYSQAFIEYTPDTPNQNFLVPAGYTAVIRQVSCSQNIGGFIFYVNYQNDLTAPLVQIFQGAQDGVSNYVGAEGRWVVPGGGNIYAAVSELGSAISMYVGGYLLVNDEP
jgi:hypothetical protein